jgi:hypothetical protein
LPAAAPQLPVCAWRRVGRRRRRRRRRNCLGDDGVIDAVV